MNTYDSVPHRIGKFSAEDISQITVTAMYQKSLEVSKPAIAKWKPNQGTTAVFRRYLNYGGDAYKFTKASPGSFAKDFVDPHLLAEGVTPSLDSITVVDVQIGVHQYGMAYGFTDRTFDFGEKELPRAIKDTLGKRKGTLEEMIDYASVVPRITQIIYAGGGSTRASVCRQPRIAGLQKVHEMLLSNSAEFLVQSGKTSPNYGSEPPIAGGLAFTPVISLSDYSSMEGWIPVEKYAGRTAKHPFEYGTVHNVSMIFSPHFHPILGAGEAANNLPDGQKPLRATDGHVDVCQTVILAKGAWAKIDTNALGSMEPTLIMPSTIDKSDPLGQRGMYGMKMYAGSMMVSEGYAAVYEHGVSDNTADF